jgi:hypothetical protein
MTATATPRDEDWQSFTWHKRAAMIAQLAKREQILVARVDALAAERRELEAALDRLRGELDDELAVIDLRTTRPNLRIIWPAASHWTTAELRQAHAAYNAGDRDEWSITGHRIYDAERKRDQRRRATSSTRSTDHAATA